MRNLLVTTLIQSFSFALLTANLTIEALSKVIPFWLITGVFGFLLAVNIFVYREDLVTWRDFKEWWKDPRAWRANLGDRGEDGEDVVVAYRGETGHPIADAMHFFIYKKIPSIVRNKKTKKYRSLGND